MAPIFINEKQARTVLESAYDELFRRMERALSQYSSQNGTIIQPVRSWLDIPAHSGRTEDLNSFLTMPAYSQPDGAISTKLLSIFPGNKDCKPVNAVVALFNADNGLLQAVVEGNAITDIRTAIASAVAVHHLSSHTDRRTIAHLAILGSGFQATSHIDVFKSLFDIGKITIWSRTFQHAQRLANEKNAEAYATVEETVRNADVIVTATNSVQPILKAVWLKPKVLICSVGACRADWRELDDDVMTSSLVVTDSLDGAKIEAGDIIQTNTKVDAEIGELINGTKSLDLENATRIIFKSLGMAVEDTVAAKLVFDQIVK